MKASIYRRTTKWQKTVVEEASIRVLKLKEMVTKGELLFPRHQHMVDCVTKSKFDNVCGCRHSLNDGIMRATDVTIGGKRALVCGYGDVGKGCAFVLRGSGARVFIAECDPTCDLQACMEGFQVAAIESAVSEIDISVSSTGNFNVITLDHMKKEKNHAIVGNIGHFDNEIDLCDGAGFRPTSECGLRHWPSVLRDVVFVHESGAEESNRSINPDEDVGYGAAVQAAIFAVVGSSQAQDLLLVGTTSSSTALEMTGGHDEADRTKHHHYSREEGTDVHGAR